MIELPKYQCHKVVRAAKIASAEHIGGHEFSLQLMLDSGRMSHSYIHLGAATNASALVGKYLVQYDDGYESVSPAKAFEEGYTLVRETVTPEAKAVVAAAKRESKKVTP
jgi:hypothetical protein